MLDSFVTRSAPDKEAALRHLNQTSRQAAARRNSVSRAGREDARRFIGERPRTFAEISQMLTQLMPDQDVGAMRYAVRTHLPLVQVPVSSGWSYSNKPNSPWLNRGSASQFRRITTFVA